MEVDGESRLGFEADEADAVSVEWRRAIEEVIAGELVPAIVYQPIVDLQRGAAVGYEALARFPEPPIASPDRWFTQAAAMGLGLELERVTLAHTLPALARLPPNTFLSINVSPALLASSAWRELLGPFRRLDRLVVEVTEHHAIEDYDGARRALHLLRERGALFAVDDAGSGYASMQHVLALRPDFVKVDRLFVADCDRDPARAAVIEAVGSLAARLDAWIVAEGVERPEELECLLRLGAPLAQGWLLGRPSPGWDDTTPAAQAAIAAHRRRADDLEGLGALMEPGGPLVAGTISLPGFATARLLIDEHGRPVRWMSALRLNADSDRPLMAKRTTPIKAIARRAMVRPEPARFLPIVCTDDQGRYVGMVRIERLIERLAAA